MMKMVLLWIIFFFIVWLSVFCIVCFVLYVGLLVCDIIEILDDMYYYCDVFVGVGGFFLVCVE